MARKPRRKDATPQSDDWRLPYNIELYKELTLSYRGPLEAKVEAAQAEASLYGWWWRFLKANPDYPPGPALSQDRVRAALYRDFGELGESFQDWWQERGRKLFREQGNIPLIRLIETEPDPTGPMFARSVVLEVPMTISREVIMEQLNFVLDRFHPGDALLRHQYSTAQWPIYPRPRYRRDKLGILLSVWKARQRNPQPTFWEIGRELNLAPWLKIQEVDASRAASDIKKELGDKVARLYVQAEKLVHNAALGHFPRDDRKVTSEEVRRTSRYALVS